MTTLFIAIGSFIVAYGAGRLYERWQWNVLIRKGVLPKPSK